MADDSVVVVHDDDDSKIVTKFLLNACEKKTNVDHVPDGVLCCMCATMKVDNEFHLIPLLTGSSAEFYIRPMLSCVGDVDIMYHFSCDLAIPEGYPPPTDLPAKFHSRVKVYQIIDSEYPGYVYLMLSYLLTEDSDTGKYNAICLPYYERLYASKVVPHEFEHHGPAIPILTHGTYNMVSFDLVHCVRCLSWPPQAADWPTRQRNYDWPDSATVDRVVSNGCDVVCVTHHQCRQDEWMSKYQWRLSFSRAEIVLLNSWTPVQQIVYHMLRIFTKGEHLTDIRDNTGTKIISNYNFKTLTLWACELKPQRWWTDDINVVRICAELLRIFADWLRNEICPHYFISSCNLIYNTVNLEMIVSQLTTLTESWLSTWFVNNHLRKCAQLCPDRVSRLFDDVSTSMKLQNAVSAVVDWRRRSSADRYLWLWGNRAENFVNVVVSKCSLSVWSWDYWINELVNIDLCFRVYYTAFAFLHIAKKMANRSLSEELLDVLATIIGQFVNKQRYYHQLSSDLSLSQAVILMKVVANNSRSTVQQIEFELSKAYLHRALRCKDSDSDSIYCLANVYLAVLYYTSGQYQTTIDHCTLVMRSQDHSQCSSRVVQGDLLPKIDDHIDVVLGLAVFYQYVRTTALNQQQTQYVVAFTTELFAHYLYIRCLSLRSVMKCPQFTQMLLTDEVHKKYIVDMGQLHVADVLLLRVIKMLSELKCHCKQMSEQQHLYSTIDATELNSSELVELLQQSAVEHLTTYRELQAQQFGSAATVVTTDFEALYAYKRGDYQWCLQLSTHNVFRLLYAVYQISIIDMSRIPEFIQLMDDDIVSLTALTLIVISKYGYERVNNCIGQVTLSLYLMTQCQLKLHHSLTSLAQTLDYIVVIQRRCPVDMTLDHLILKLIKCKVAIYLSNMM